MKPVHQASPLVLPLQGSLGLTTTSGPVAWSWSPGRPGPRPPPTPKFPVARRATPASASPRKTRPRSPGRRHAPRRLQEPCRRGFSAQPGRLGTCGRPTSNRLFHAGRLEQPPRCSRSTTRSRCAAPPLAPPDVADGAPEACTVPLDHLWMSAFFLLLGPRFGGLSGGSDSSPAGSSMPRDSRKMPCLQRGFPSRSTS